MNKHIYIKDIFNRTAEFVFAVLALALTFILLPKLLKRQSKGEKP